MSAALFFDVDGTLVDSYHDNRTISPAVQSELRRVQCLGHKIFLSSGRPRLLITPELLEPGFDGLVLVNGGYVEMNGASIFEERMERDLAYQTAAFLEDMGYEYLMVAAHHTYMRPTNRGLREFFSGVNERNMFTFEYDFDEIVPEIIKMEALVPVEERDRVTAAARATLGPRISCDGHGGAGTYELYPTAISKARGIEVILNELGIDASQAYAFGDGTNDLEMIQYCGCGVAMGNAEDAVKEAADIVCPPVWDDGLAQVLRDLF